MINDEQLQLELQTIIVSSNFWLKRCQEIIAEYEENEDNLTDDEMQILIDKLTEIRGRLNIEEQVRTKFEQKYG